MARQTNSDTTALTRSTDHDNKMTAVLTKFYSFLFSKPKTSFEASHWETAQQIYEPNKTCCDSDSNRFNSSSASSSCALVSRSSLFSASHRSSAYNVTNTTCSITDLLYRNKTKSLLFSMWNVVCMCMVTAAKPPTATAQ